MKKLNIVFALFLAMSLMLTACGSAADNEGTPGFTNEPGFTEEPTSVSTEMATEMLETPATGDLTETPAMTEEVQVTETAMATEMLPDTGFVDPGRVSNLLDFDVWNQDNEQIGTTEDMVINLESKQVDYVIVEVGGFLGIGGKQVAVPYDRFQVVTNESSTTDDGPQNAFIIDATRDELESAPEFDDDLLPNLGDPARDWDADLSGYWEGGMVTATEESGTPEATEVMTTPEATDTTGVMAEGNLQGAVLATDLLGMTVQDAQNNDLAEVQDVIIDPQSGDVNYAVVEVSGIEDIDGQWLLIPLDHLSINAQDNVLVVSTDSSTLVDAPTFDADQLPDTTAPDWDADIQSFWDSLM